MYPNKAQVIDLRNKVRTPSRTRMIYEELQKRGSLSASSLNNSSRLQEFSVQLEKDANKPYWRYPRPSPRSSTRIVEPVLLSAETTPVSCNIVNSRVTPQLKTIVRRRVEPGLRSNVFSVPDEELQTDSDYQDAFAESDLFQAPPLTMGQAPKAGFLTSNSTNSDCNNKSNVALHESTTSPPTTTKLTGTSSKLSAASGPLSDSINTKTTTPIAHPTKRILQQNLFEFDEPVLRGPKRPKIFVDIVLKQSTKEEFLGVGTDKIIAEKGTDKGTITDNSFLKPPEEAPVVVASKPLEIPLVPTAPSKISLVSASAAPLTDNGLAKPAEAPIVVASKPSEIPLVPAVPSKIPLVPAVPSKIPLVPAISSSCSISGNSIDSSNSIKASGNSIGSSSSSIPLVSAPAAAAPAFQFGNFPSSTTAQNNATTNNGFSFGAPPQPSFSLGSNAFKFTATNDAAPGALSNGAGGTTSNAFQFGALPSSTTTEQNNATTNNGFSFGAPSQPSFSLGSNAFKFTATNDAAPGALSNGAGGTTSNAFQFGGLPSSASGQNLANVFSMEPSANRYGSSTTRKLLAAKRKTNNRR